MGERAEFYEKDRDNWIHKNMLIKNLIKSKVDICRSLCEKHDFDERYVLVLFAFEMLLEEVENM